MKTGALNKLITISTSSDTVTDGNSVTTWSTPVSVRASVIQVDGTRYLKEDELIDREVYKIVLWNNSYTSNIKIVTDGMTLYPIRPLTINSGKSNMEEVIIYAATKK